MSIVLDGPCHRCGKRGQQWLIGINCAVEPQQEFAWCGPACASAEGSWPPAILGCCQLDLCLSQTEDDADPFFSPEPVERSAAAPA